MTTVALSCRFVRNLAIGSMLLVPVCAAQPAAAQAPPAVQWRVEDGGNGHWYRVDVWTKSIEWTTARIHAAELGGHLVTITTEAEDLWILSLVMNTDGAWEGVRGPWLGAFAEAPCTSGDACFEWITGEPFSYTRWHPGNPDNVSSTDPTGMVNVLLWEPSWTRAWQDVGPENPGLSTGGRSAIIEWSADCNNDGFVDYGQILSGELADANANGVPDSCELVDGDGDGVGDSTDNCPSVPNADQADCNANGVGDACESSSDQFLRFGAGTDTVELDRSVVVGAEYTYEARLRLPAGAPLVEGRIYSDQNGANTDKALAVRPGPQGTELVLGQCCGAPFHAIPAPMLADGTWHHVAMVRTSSSLRCYVDGALIADVASSGTPGPSGGSRSSLGGFRYAFDGGNPTAPSAVMDLDWLRISSVARYDGTYTAPPAEEAVSSDESTLMLFRFTDAGSSTTVTDESPSGVIGSRGTGYPAATNPPSFSDSFDQGQCDTDGDGTPDWADNDDDNDGVVDSQDAFPLDPSESFDTDGDGIGNNADTDDDGDSVADGDDACPTDNGPCNGCPLSVCGSCDPLTDADSDGVADCIDNCISVANPTQADCDVDGVGDACEETVFLADDFDDGMIDPAKWSVVLPNGCSQVREELGSLYTEGRGQLRTMSNLREPRGAQPIRVEFDWQDATGSGEIFSAIVRTASSAGPCCDAIGDGLFLSYYGGVMTIYADGGLDSIDQSSPAFVAPATWYHVALAYTNSLFSVEVRSTVDNRVLWQASVPYTGVALGEGLNFNSREFCGTASRIDNVRVVAGDSPCACTPCDPTCPGYDACACEGGTACDIDQDGFGNDVDNCPLAYNPDQSDVDGDGAGDVCDSCPTGSDPCNPSCSDYDPCACYGPCSAECPGDPCACGVPCFPGCPGYDPCACGDPWGCDSDGDGTPNAQDACPNQAGPCNGCPQNSCGTCGAADDSDGDGVPDCVDNCLWAYNPDQVDQDGDGQGDPCDPCAGGSDPCNPSCPDWDPCACDPWSCNPCNPASPNYDPCLCPGDCNCPANCPPPDSDGDGIIDDLDQCPVLAGDPACNGCPTSYCNPCDPTGPAYDPCQCPGDCACPGACDLDGDGVPDSIDQCPNEYGEPSCNGCPWWVCDPCQGDPCCGNPCCWNPWDCSCNPSQPDCDLDGDGVPNINDGCPSTPGNSACNGCPDWCGACTFVDCNSNGLADSCELTQGTDGRELLFDGGFEQATFGGCPNPCSTSCNFPLPGWQRGWITEDLIRNIDGCLPTNPTGGQYYISLQGSVCCDCDNNGSITQYLAGLVAGGAYRFEMDVFLDEWDALQVTLGSQSFVISPTTTQVDTWQRVSWEFIADGSESFITVASIGTPDAPGCLEAGFAHVDNLSLRQRVTATDCNRNGVPDECDLASGIADCNANGIPDSCDLQQGAPDCNGNQIPDSCDIADKVMEDCNANGIGDQCEKQVDVVAVSPRIAPIGFGAPATWSVPSAVQAVENVDLFVRAKGDFGGSLEWIDVTVGDSGAAGTVFRFFGPGGPDCQVADGYVWLTPQAFNNAIRSDGTLQVRAVASIAVDAGHCFGDTWIEFELRYTGAAAPDCNANGLLDSCELAAGYAVDANGNGVIDGCEAPITQCPGDYDFDQAITGQDLSLLLAAWGTANQQVDLTGDGQVDGNDMAVLLAGWGTCAD